MMTVVVLMGCTSVGLTLVLLLIGAEGCVLSVDVSASRCASRVTSVDVEVSSCRSSDDAEISTYQRGKDERPQSVALGVDPS